MVETTDLSTFIEFASKADNSIVAKTVVGDVEVSTVFMAQPKFAFAPMDTYFETMLFDLVRADEVDREAYAGWPEDVPGRSVYATYADAQKGHEYIVQQLTSYFSADEGAYTTCVL